MDLVISYEHNGLALLGLRVQELHEWLDDAHTFRWQSSQQLQDMAEGRMPW